VYRIARQRCLVRQQRISNVNAPLASQERPDFAKIENRPPSAKRGLAGKSFVDIARDEKTRELIAGYIGALNLELNRWEQIKCFAIAERELSVKAGDLTPSMRLRRKAANAKHYNMSPICKRSSKANRHNASARIQCSLARPERNSLACKPNTPRAATVRPWKTDTRGS
jgi:hypothetical protein